MISLHNGSVRNWKSLYRSQLLGSLVYLWGNAMVIFRKGTLYWHSTNLLIIMSGKASRMFIDIHYPVSIALICRLLVEHYLLLLLVINVSLALIGHPLVVCKQKIRVNWTEFQILLFGWIVLDIGLTVLNPLTCEADIVLLFSPLN